MRKYFAILFTLLLCVSAFAQQRTGNITGKVADPEGNTLPGVTVTLINPFGAAMTSVTSVEGIFRFLSLPPSRNYGVRLELTGFKTKIEEGIVVTVGSSTNMNFTLEIGVLEEQVTVTAVSPMVDTKKTAVGINVTQEVLQSLPTARDPWVILQMAPSVVMDRENIGGAESGQQSTYVSKGSTTYNNNVWAMDGIVITDPAAIGASPSYYDFDAFEEMQITVGGADVTVQTGGVALNMVTRRGGNRITLGGRFYVIDEKFQADNFKPEFAKQGALGVNKIRTNKDYGFNLGLPLIKDKAWVWASYGVMDIKTTTVYNKPDDTLLQNYVGKLNLQIIPQNRFEAFAHIGGKIKYGRSSTVQNPEGLYQQGRYHFGSPIFKIQDEHMFGDNLFISLKFAFSDAGFSLTPMTDLNFEKVPIWDVTAQRYYESQASRYYVERPVKQYNALLNYFNDSFLGASHDIKAGFEYAGRRQYVESVWSGNFIVNKNYNTPTVDFDANGTADVPSAAVKPYFNRFRMWRGYYADQFIDAYSAYVSDTVTFGRFNLILGVRWDYQTPSLNPLSVLAVDKDSGAWKKIATADTATKLETLLPSLQIPQTKGTARDGSKYAWQFWSPRLGLTWDVTGDGKTIAKLSLGMYGDFMGTGLADRWRPGGVGGWMDFWWWDNGDGIMDWKELYWANYRTAPLYQYYRVFNDAGNFVGKWSDGADGYWGGYDYANPTKVIPPYAQTEKESGSTRTSEVMLTLEREIFTDFAVSIIGTYRRYDQFNWELKYFPATGVLQNQGWYISAGKPPATLPGLGSTKDAANHEWYYTSTAGTAYSPYTIFQRMPSDRYNDFWGVDLIFNKRLSNKWMLNGSVTYQTQAAHYGTKGYMDPTNIWAYEGQDSSAYIGAASGLLDQYTNARWLAKLAGLYQLPWDFNISFNFQAREGWIIDEYFYLMDYTLPNPASRAANLRMSKFASNRLPSLINLGLRLEKMLRLGDTGRIFIMADMFNVMNEDTAIRRQQKYMGAYYKYANPALDRWVPWPSSYNIDGILNPRVLRLGVRFTF